MTVYKLTVSLDATLAVQNPNGSFHYFKPSIGAEFTTDETDDLTIMNQKFDDLYTEVIGPNFKSVVSEFLINSENDKQDGIAKKECGCKNESCDCEPLTIGEKPESEDVEELNLALPIADGLPKEEWE